MMASTTFQGGWGVPGAGDAIETSEREIFWGGDWGKGQILTASASFATTLADAGNTPTTDIRPGLLVGKITSSGELAAWDADNSDGTQNIWGINFLDLRMIDFNSTAADRIAPVCLRAPLKASHLLIQGTALTSHVDEYLARRQLHALGCILDDDPHGFLAGAGGRIATVTGTTDTLTGDENGSTIFYSNAASVTVTLPTIAAGLEFLLIRTADEEFIVTSAEGDNIIVGHDLSADSVTFTTAGQQIGAAVKITGVYVGTTLKWVADLPTPPSGTGFTGGFAYSIAT